MLVVWVFKTHFDGETMDEKSKKRISKLLSLVLRHSPQTVGISLDDAGWVDVVDLLRALEKHPRGRGVNEKNLREVVETNDKKRFEFDSGGKRIRASQGHSIAVDLGYAAAQPPETLLHGTPERFIEPIRASGLKKMNRHHVHLHADEKTSAAVGARRGKPVLLVVRAGEMQRVGFEFFVTPNGVWLTDHVPVEFIEFPQTGIE